MEKKPIECYPFLSGLPEPVLRKIDLGVLYIPSLPEAVMLKHLEATLGKNLVIYKAGVQPQGRHLCQTIKPAVLTEEQCRVLMKTEKDMNEGDPIRKIIVAYEKNLVLW